MLLVAVGVAAATALSVAEMLDAQGIASTVVDPRWVLPVSTALTDLAAGHRLVVTIEDGLADGGVGDAIRAALAAQDRDVPLRTHGVPTRFLGHATRSQLLDDLGLRPQDIARATAATFARLDDRESEGAQQDADRDAQDARRD